MKTFLRYIYLFVCTFLSLSLNANTVRMTSDVDSIIISFHAGDIGITTDVLITRDHATLAGDGENFVIEELDYKRAQMLYGFIDDMFISKRSEIYLFKEEFDDVMMTEPCILDIYVSNKDYSKRISQQFYTRCINYNNANSVDTVENIAVKYSDTFRKLVSSMLALSQEYEILNSFFQTEKYWAPWEKPSEALQMSIISDIMHVTYYVPGKTSHIDLCFSTKGSMFVVSGSTKNNRYLFLDSIPSEQTILINRFVYKLLKSYKKFGKKNEIIKSKDIDLIDDLYPLFITLKHDDGFLEMEYWYNEDSCFGGFELYPLPTDKRKEVEDFINYCQLAIGYDDLFCF